MHGQQSFSTLAMYFMHSKSAGRSFPLSSAAFSQTGQALLISSMQRTSRSCGQSAAEASPIKAPRARSNFIFVYQISQLLQKIQSKYFLIQFIQLQKQLQIYFIKILSKSIFQRMIQQSKKQAEQLKKFTFFQVEPLTQKISDPSSHPRKINDVNVSDIVMIKNKILFLDKSKNQVLVYGKCIEGQFQPHSAETQKIYAPNSSFNQVLVTYGQDAQDQSRSVYIKFWYLPDNMQDYEQLMPKKIIVIGKLGEPQRIVSSIHILPDFTLMTLGTKRGTILVYESKNILEADYKMSTKIVQKKQIRYVAGCKRGGQVDVYFSNQESFYWFENLVQKRRIIQNQVTLMQPRKSGNIIVTFKNDKNNIFEFHAGKQIRSHLLQGQKTIIKEFRQNYLIVVTFEKKSNIQKGTDKYIVQILDTLNVYIAYTETFSKVQNVLVNDNVVILVVCNQKGERLMLALTERENSFKIQTFFKKSFYNEAYRFAKNQNCKDSLLAQISRLHGDALYGKGQLSNAIKQYILTIGFVEPSYVIRKYLDVSQIDFLIEYLQKVHERKIAKKQHTALLLNCYVKKQKIENLSKFLSQSSLQSDLFDIQTAIKVCKDLNHFEEAMKLAQQKNKHQLYLKILIQNKKDYDKAIQYIRIRVPLEEKEKYLIEFGPQFMKFFPKKTIQIIKLLIRAHSISQVIRGKQRDYVLSPDQRTVFEQLNTDVEDLEILTTITFKKPDDFFRLFMSNTDDLQNFLVYLNNEIPKLPNEQVVFHRLIEFYLQMMKQSPSRQQQYSQKILQNLQHTTKKPDNNHLLVLFKMYEYDEGIITLCKKLNMRDDLLNFYIAKNRDNDIMDLCKQHGNDEVNLWIHALKYFVKPQFKKEYYIPEILQQLAKIPNLSPLPILSILSKSKNIQYQYIKGFFLHKLRQDRSQIEVNQSVVAKNTTRADEARAEFKKLKTTAKPFLSNNCVQCQNGLNFPSIHFMCGHSFHQHCLGGQRQCSRCGFEMRNIVQRKQRYEQSANDQTKLFEVLHERKQSGFEVISEFLGKGLFNKLF